MKRVEEYRMLTKVATAASEYVKEGGEIESLLRKYIKLREAVREWQESQERCGGE